MNRSESDSGLTELVEEQRAERAQRKLSERLDKQVEVVAAILLALATLASAWSAYQATLWGGLQTELLNEASAARAESLRKSNEALALQQVDVNMFLQYAVAVSTNNQTIVDFLRARFRPEMRVALDAWQALEPLKNQNAPPSPFAMPEYQLQTRKDSDALLGQAEATTLEAQRADDVGDNYVRQTVLFAVVLLFSGLATTLDYRPVKIGVLLLAFGVFAFALLAVARSPIQV